MYVPQLLYPFICQWYARLCGALELALSAQAKEELAAAMVRVLRATGRAQVRRRDGTNPGDQGLTDRVLHGGSWRGPVPEWYLRGAGHLEGWGLN